MNSYRELPTRYLKAKKERYITIIIGIIVSVALITGVFTMVESIKGKVIEAYEETNRAYSNIYNIKGEEIPKIINNAKVEKAAFSTILGNIKRAEDNTRPIILTADSIESIYLSSIDKMITEGQVPTKPGEIILSEDYLKEINKKIGDKVTIQYEDVLDSNKIKDITAEVVATSIDNYNVFIVDEASIQKDRKYGIALRYKDVKDTMEATEELKAKLNIKDIKAKEEDKPYLEINKSYISLLGETVDEFDEAETLRLVQFILIFFVIIASMGLIYNGFMISVNERNKEFSLLRAVGISKKQIRKIVLKEATIVGTIGIALGLIVGVITSYLILYLIERIDMIDIGAIKLKLSLISIAFSIGVSVLTIALSLIIPLNRLSKISPVEGMKNKFIDYKTVKVEKGISLFDSLRKGPSYMAKKNLRRNRGRYRTIVFGFALSIFIFIAFNSFVDILSKVMDIEMSIVKPGIIIQPGTNIEKVKALDGVKYIYNENILTNLDTINFIYAPSQDVKQLGNLTEDFKNRAKKRYSHTIKNIDENILKEEILKDKNTDINKLKKGIVIQNNLLIFEDKKRVPIKITNYKVGDKIDLVIPYKKINTETEVTEDKTYILKDVEIVGIEEEPVVELDTGTAEVGLYMGEEVFKNVLKEIDSEGSILNVVILAESLEKEKEIYKELNTNYSKYNTEFIWSPSQDKVKVQEAVFAAKIGVYAFLGFITLITLSNIITSITSSIEDRRKEIALLRSVGTSKTFIKKMIFLENINYFTSSIIIGGILGIATSVLITYAYSAMYEGIYVFPIKSIAIVSIILILFIGIISKYSINKLCNNNIVEELREE